jgi:heptosyltransferase-1
MFRAGKRESGDSGPRILVVRLGAMGDIIHTLPAVATLKHGFPGSTLCWVVHPRWAPLLEGNPYVDRLALLDRHHPGSIAPVWRALRGDRYDFAVDFQGLFKAALVASLARADRIFGFHQSQVREKFAALFYSDRVRATAGHIVDRNLELAAATGASTILRTFPLPPGAPEGPLPEGDFVLANPHAGWGAKQWPLACYEVLASRLREELGVALVLNSTPESAPELASVRGAVVYPSGLGGLIDATRRALGIVGLDSGPLHLAAALGKPGVAIFGPTNPERNGPYGDTFTVLRSQHAVTSHKRLLAMDRSMLDIAPDEVFAALKARISSQSQSAGSRSR